MGVKKMGFSDWLEKNKSIWIIFYKQLFILVCYIFVALWELSNKRSEQISNILLTVTNVVCGLVPKRHEVSSVSISTRNFANLSGSVRASI